MLPTAVTGSYVPGTNTISLLPGDFPVGRSMTFTFDVTVDPGAAGTDQSNRATITYDGATLAELQDLTFSTPAATTRSRLRRPRGQARFHAGHRDRRHHRHLDDHRAQQRPEHPAAVVVTDDVPNNIPGVTATASPAVRRRRRAGDLRMRVDAEGTVTITVTSLPSRRTRRPPS